MGLVLKLKFTSTPSALHAESSTCCPRTRASTCQHGYYDKKAPVATTSRSSGVGRRRRSGLLRSESSYVDLSRLVRGNSKMSQYEI